MRTLVIAAALMLGGCAGTSYALQYRGVEVERFRWDESTWRIFDKPTEGRLMITPTLLRSARSGFFSGLTFGALDTDIPKPRYQGAVVSWLEDTGRTECAVTDGYEVIRPQWEFKYNCPSTSAAQPSRASEQPPPAVLPSAPSPASNSAFPPITSSGAR